MGISKRLKEARKAYEKGDIKGSARAHARKTIKQAEEKHGGAGSQYLGEMVYGGLDGIITTFAVVTGVAGAAAGFTSVVLILGLANLFADGFSMAVGSVSLGQERAGVLPQRDTPARGLGSGALPRR